MVRALGDGESIEGAELRLKVPPNSIETEQSVLGGVMLDNSAWDKIADVVVETDFYRKDHRIIFAGIAALAEDSKPCDVVTLSEHLDNRGELEDAGGLEYLATLANETPGAANARAAKRSSGWRPTVSVLATCSAFTRFPCPRSGRLCTWIRCSRLSTGARCSGIQT